MLLAFCGINIKLMELMELIEIKAIMNRRSIRKYKSQPVPKEMIEKILKAGILAPSSKNRQPWKFIIVTGNAKVDVLKQMEKGLEREKVDPFLPESAKYLQSAEATLKIMKTAPVIIFIINPLAADMKELLSTDERISEICNAQSIGAAIENMILEATELGLGTLWICDIFFAYQELSDWLGINIQGELYAALAIGYGDETPNARPRKPFTDVVEWRD